MCDCCQQPEKCEKGKDPKSCTEEQIQECHGSAGKHACAEETVKAGK